MGTEILTAAMQGAPPPLPFLQIDHLRRWPGSERSEKHAHFAALVERTIGAVGAPLLRVAHDEDALLAVIDDALESGSFEESSRRLMAGLRDLGVDFEDFDAKSAMAEFRRGLRGDELRGMVAEALDATMKTWAIIGVAQASETGDVANDAPLESADRLAFIARAPLRIARELLALVRGNVASFGVIYGLPDLEPDGDGESMMRLARLWRDGSIAGLRLLASLAPVDVPEEVFPMSERLDPEAIRAEVEAADARVRELRARRERDGLPDPDDP